MRAPLPLSTLVLSCVTCLALAAPGCNSPPTAIPEATPAAIPGAAPASEWKPLFDGKTLESWKRTPFPGETEPRVEDGQLLIPRGDPMTGATYTGHFPREGYEIELEAMRVDGGDFFCGLTFPVGKGHASLILGGWGGGVTGISSINHRDASENETTTYRQYETGQWYKVRLVVTPTTIEAWLDDERIVDVETTGKEIEVRADIEGARPLGLSTYRTTGAIRNLRWRAVSGDDA